MSQTKIKRGPSSATKSYLLAYNGGSAALWGYVLIRALRSLAQTGDITQTFPNASKDLVWIQPLAVLEIFHALFGLVRSPVMTTISQVSSRLLLAVGILYCYPLKEATEHWALSTMTIAWSITEVIRYLFYAFNLVGTAPSFIIWCRYSLFYILYPVGASSEMFVAYQALPHLKTTNPAFYYTLVAILFYYPLGFYQLFTYMIKQRAKTLGGKSKKVE